VIHALDIALNGRAVSGVGIEYERRRKSRLWGDGVQLALQGGAVLVLASLATFLLCIWGSMRRRVVRLDAFLGQAQVENDVDQPVAHDRATL
jgi:hypothetical protein